MRRLVSLFVALILVSGGAFALSSVRSDALSPGVSFGAVDQPTWQTNNVVYGIAAARGKVFAGGQFTQIRPGSGMSGSTQNRVGLVVLDAATGIPTSCQFTISGGSSRVRAVVASPDESTVYIAGEFGAVNGVSRNRLAALDVDSCTLKTGFNGGTISAEVFGLAVHDNTLYVAGGFSAVRGETRQYFAAMNATTGALLPWTANGESYQNAPAAKRGRAVAVSPDGAKVVLGGYFYYVNGTFSHSIAMVTGVDAVTGEGGSLLKTYPQGFIPGNPNATSSTTEAPSGTSATHAIAVGTNDGMFYIANEGIGGGVFDGRAAFRWSDGEQVWRDTCLGATQAVLEDSGTLYSASHAHDCSGNNAFADGKRTYFKAQSTATGEIYGWEPMANDGTGEGIGPRALTIATAASGKRYLWAGGEFTQINGSGQQGLTRFADQSAAPATPSAVAQAMTNGTIQVRFRTVFDQDDSQLTYRVYRTDRGSDPIWEGQGVSYWWELPQGTFVDSDVTPGTNYSYRVAVFDGTNTRTSATVSARAISPTSDYTSTILASDPDGFYWNSTNSGTWVQDVGATASKMTGRNGISQGGVTKVSDSPIQGDGSGSFSFDGVDDYILNDRMEAAPTNYSIETWFKTTTTTGGKLIGYGNGRPKTNSGDPQLSTSYDRQIYMTNDGRLIFGTYTGGFSTITSPAGLNDGEWHQVVGTQGPNGMSLYVDGLRVGSNSNSQAQSYRGVWHVGGDQLNGWPNKPTSNYFAGLLDETAVYSIVLSRQDVLNHAAAGGLDVEVNSSPADAYGAEVFGANPDLYWRLNDGAGETTAKDSSFFGQLTGVYNTGVGHPVEGVVGGNSGAQFVGNSTSTVANSAQQSPSAVYSAQLWFKTTVPGGKLFGFENTQTGNGANYDKHVYMTNDGRLVFGTYRNGASTITSPNGYDDGAWHQVVATQDASGMKLYVDGHLVASNSVSTSETGNGYWRVGGGNLNSWINAPSNFYFNGSLDEFAVYSSALSAETIQRQYLTLNPDHTAPSVPVDVTGSVVEGSVQLSWTASSDNVGVTGYRVYRGTTTDFVPAQENLAGTTATNSVTLPALLGTWYYKVVAVDAAENASGPSAAVEVVVPDLEAPSVPAGVSASVSGDDVTVSWSASSDNVAVTGYTVYRGDSADFVADDASKVADVTELSLVDADRPIGAFYYRVVAFDAAGNRSAASQSVAASVADSEAPSVPVDVTGSVVDGLVQLSWTASSDNVGVTGYRVYRGTTTDFVPAQENLADTTESPNATLPAEVGTWYYKVVAVDAAENASGPSAAVEVVVPDLEAPSVPAGVSASVSGDDVTVSWSASSDNVAVTGYTVYRGDSADFVADDASKVADVTELSLVDADRPIGAFYYRVVAFDAAGNRSAASQSVAASVADSEAPSVPVDVTGSVVDGLVQLSWTASSDNVGVTGYRVYRGTTTDFTVNASSLLDTVTGTTYSEARPAGTWYYKVVAVDAVGNASSASAAAAVEIADAEAPSVPAGLSASVSGDDVTVSWSASSDNVAVTGYSVYRGESPGFAVNEASKIADVTLRTYTDAGLEPGDYYYKVVARDAAGNVSGPSDAAKATVEEPTVEPMVVEVAVSDDSSVVSTSATTNYGTNTQLFARGTGGEQQIFMKFTLPDAPAGTMLKGAELRFRTSGDNAAGSADNFSVQLVSGSWTEDGLNWNNRPTSVGANLGTITGATVKNTAYTAELAENALVGQVGDTATLRISGSGSDNLRLWSGEASSSYRPVLVLTFG